MPKHIIILGGGFGGVYAMFNLRKYMRGIPYTLTLISNKEYFTFTPFLSEVVGEVLPPKDAGVSIQDLIKRKNEVFLQGTVEKIDLEQKTVYLHDHESMTYDYLVIAFGSTTNFLHVPGAVEHSFVVKNIDDAVQLKERINQMLLQAAQTDDLQKRAHLLTFAVVGGGATSIEIAGDIVEHIEKEIGVHYPQVKKNDACVMLVTGGNEIAKDFDPVLRKRAMKLLKKENVEVVLNARVKEVQENVLLLTNNSALYAHTVVWAAGVKANTVSVMPSSVIDHESQKFFIDKYLRLPEYPHVFAIGDIATSNDPARQFPMLAQIAMVEAKKVGMNIPRIERNQTLLSFSYHVKGELVTIGKGKGIANVFGIDMSGQLAWFLWKVFYFFKYIDNRKKPEILYYWIRELLNK